MRRAFLPRFLLWFSCCDLFESQARRTTGAVVFTLLVLNSFVLIVLGLIFGFREARHRQISSDPLALALYAGRPDVRKEITPRVFGAIDDSLGAKVGEAYVGCFPFQELRANWRLNAISESDGMEVTPLRGRTLASQEPFLHRLRKDAETSEPGVVFLSNRIPVIFGQPLDAARPTSAFVRTSDGRVVPVKVHLTEFTFPNGHDFLVAEDGRAVLTDGADGRALTEIFTGPIPEDWDSPETTRRISTIVADFCRTKKIRNQFAAQTVDQTLIWQITSTQPDKTSSRLREWRSLVGELAALLQENGLAVDPRFVQDVRSAQGDGGPALIPAHDGVAVYVRDVTALKPASLAIQAATTPSLPVDEDVINQVNSVADVVQSLVSTAVWVIVVLLFVSIFNIYTVLYLRYGQQTSEIGMLKAMGFNSRMLLQVYIVQGVLLAIFGAACGISIGLVVAPILAAGISQHDRLGTAVGLSFPWWLIVSQLFASQIICIICATIATYRARNDAPYRSLKYEP